MTIEPLTHKDLDELLGLQPPDWNILPAMKVYLSNACYNPIKVMVDGKIAGTGTAIKHQTSAWLGHIIVHPEFRNKGIGTIITKTLLDQLNYDTVSLIATKEGEPVYKKLGFVQESMYVVFKGENIAPPLNECIVPYTEKHKEALLKMDKLVSGEDRQGILEDYLATGKIYLSDNDVKGFFLPDLNEGLILAKSVEAGLELMKLRLSKAEGVFIPEQNKAGLEFMFENGYAETGRRQRMYFGKKLNWQPEKVYARIGGNLG